MFSRGHEVSDRPVIVFIVGAGHSGSTVLNVALGANSHVHALGEMSHLPAERGMNSKCACGAHLRECPHWVTVAARLHGSHRDDPVDIGSVSTGPRSASHGLRHLVRYCAGRLAGSAALPPWVENLTELFDIHRDVTGKQVLVDSSKSIHRAALFDIYSDRYAVRYLHLVRDVRGVSFSYTKEDPYPVDMLGHGTIELSRGSLPPKATSLAWLKVNLAASMALAGTGRRLRMSYEDLCGSPGTVLADVCSWLAVPFEREMVRLDYTDRHSVGEHGSRFSREGFRKADESWRRQFRPEQLDDISLAAKALNAYYGFRDWGLR